MASVCTPWIDPDLIDCEGDPTTSTSCDGTDSPLVFPWSNEDLALAASNLLYRRTCYQFPGVCSTEIWPCTHGCCTRHPYPCTPCVYADYVVLPHADVDPESVVIKEDGVTLDAGSYRVEGGYRIVRTDGERFARQSFGLGSGTTTTIAYNYGRPVPIELQIAARDLARELKRACTDPNGCALPDRVTSIARQGVAFTLMDLASLMNTGATGVMSVDMVLSAYGDCSAGGLVDPLDLPSFVRVV